MKNAMSAILFARYKDANGKIRKLPGWMRAISGALAVVGLYLGGWFFLKSGSLASILIPVSLFVFPNLLFYLSEKGAP